MVRETVVTISSTDRYGDKLKGVVSSFPGEADAVAYIYDGLGKMRYRQVEEDSAVTAQTWYRYDLGWNVLGEYADDGGSFWWVGAKERSFVWDGMTALAAIEGVNPATGAASDYTHDHLGSTRNVFGSGGEMLAAVGYGPYGAPSTRNAGAAPAFSYTGKPYDAATGLYHFPYRQYDPNAARWLTRDPLGMVDGPNVYAYVTGNPVGAVDPLGLFVTHPCSEAVLLCLATAGIGVACFLSVIGCLADPTKATCGAAFAACSGTGACASACGKALGECISEFD